MQQRQRQQQACYSFEFGSAHKQTNSRVLHIATAVCHRFELKSAHKQTNSKVVVCCICSTLSLRLKHCCFKFASPHKQKKQHSCHVSHLSERKMLDTRFSQKEGDKPWLRGKPSFEGASCLDTELNPSCSPFKQHPSL